MTPEFKDGYDILNYYFGPARAAEWSHVWEEIDGLVRRGRRDAFLEAAGIAENYLGRDQGEDSNADIWDHIAGRIRAKAGEGEK